MYLFSSILSVFVIVFLAVPCCCSHHQLVFTILKYISLEQTGVDGDEIPHEERIPRSVRERQEQINAEEREHQANKDKMKKEKLAKKEVQTSNEYNVMQPNSNYIMLNYGVLVLSAFKTS